MSAIPFISFILATITVLSYCAGLGVFAMFPMAITAVVALAGVLFGDPERPVSSRIACLVAIALASVPLMAPAVQSLRMQHLAQQRARETRPLYEALEQTVEELRPKILAYYEQHGIMPEMEGSSFLPYVDESGRLRQRPAMPGLEAPVDPFNRIQSLRWVAVDDAGVLLVSTGQSGVAEMPLPGVPMDGPPRHRLAPFASTGADPRLHTYDPTNGALGLGDVIHWVGHEEYEDAFEELFSAWNAAHERSPYRPTVRRRATEPDPDPQSRRDAYQAEALFREQRYLAALALSSRALNERSPYPAQWDAYERRLNFIKGMSLYHLAAYREAADSLVFYLDHAPNDATAHYYLASAMWRGGSRQSAILHMAAASQIDPRANFVDQATRAFERMSAGQEPVLPEPWILRR